MAHSGYKNYVVLNFAYGTGPYLRTTDLAIAFNNELEKCGQSRLGIIVPWVYGDKQKKVMLEEFAGHEQKYPGEILLDAELGAILKSIFYGDSSYEDSLAKWTDNVRSVSTQAKEHLLGTLNLETFSGGKEQVNGKDIVIELNRSPRLRYNIAPSYFTSFGYIGEILEAATKEPKDKIAVQTELLQAGVETANWAEQNHQLHCISYPATFSFSDDYKNRYPDEILVPPIGPVPAPNNELIEKGIFVTITGIPGLERLYAEARALGVKLYSNDTKAVASSIRALPHIIPNKNILFQFARSGWSSIWLSMIVGTPLVVPDFDPRDDPEIYFNNLAVEKLGIGLIYRGEPLTELLQKAEKVREAQAKIRAGILAKWGTLDGTAYCAKLFVDEFLKAK
ncbi:MAG TPA: hypothetical protein VJC04_01105 [Candidatus Paceibacterota bacterium]